MKKPLYFASEHELIPIALSAHIDQAKEDGIKELTLFEAIEDKEEKTFIMCGYDLQVNAKSECNKGMCPHYLSKYQSGAGNCWYREKLYKAGKEVKFELTRS